MSIQVYGEVIKLDSASNNTNSKTLNKDKFNNMSIQEQIQIVNKFIKLGDSINNIAKMLGYNETTLRDRYKRAGYTRVNKRGIFVLNDQLEEYRARENKENKENKENQQELKKVTTTYKKTDKGATIKMNKEANTKKVPAEAQNKQENLLNTIELGDNIFKLLPAKQGTFSEALELNNAVKRNINIRTSKELSRKLLSIYNFLTSVEPEAGDTVNYTSIITGALSIYFDQLQEEYGELFNNHIVTAGADTPSNNHHKAIADLIKRVNEE